MCSMTCGVCVVCVCGVCVCSVYCGAASLLSGAIKIVFLCYLQSNYNCKQKREGSCLSRACVPTGTLL